MLVILALVAMVTLSNGQTLRQSSCSSRRLADIGGANPNVVIGGLFPISTKSYGTFGCGPVGNAPINMQAFEAARFALDRINNNNYIPGVRLGMRAYDTCSSGSIASRAISDFYPQFSSSQLQCTGNSLQIVPGIVGAQFSEVTETVASLLSSSNVAQVSYSPDDVSDRFHFPNLLRTSTSPDVLAQGVSMLIDELQWEYVGLVYSEDESGKKLMEAILKKTYKKGVCIPHMVAMPMMTQSDDVIADLLQPIVESEVTGVIYVGRNEKISSMLDALKNLNANQVSKLQWIFSSVDPSAAVTSNLFQGSLSFTPVSQQISEFAQYFTAIDPFNPPTQNPWFQDWYMATNKCSLPGTTNQLYQNLPQCSRTTQQSRSSTFQQDASVEPVIKAVYVLANALRRARSAECQGSIQLFCTRFKDMAAANLLNYVRATSFTFGFSEAIPSLNFQQVTFNAQFDLNTDEGFNIWNYNDRSAAVFRYVQVGTFRKANGVNLNRTLTTMYNNDRVTPLSNLPTSSCVSGNCSYCALPDFDIEYYTTGLNYQILLGGVFPVHQSDPLGYTCGHIDLTGSLHSLAYFYAIQQARTQYPELNIEGLFIDSCDRGGYVANGANAFLQKMQYVMDQNNQMLQPDFLMGFVDGSETKSAVALANILQPLEFPDLGSRATGSILQDTEVFPYYASTVPSDAEEAIAMVQFLTMTRFFYIQAVYTADENGRHAYMEFKKAADVRGVCLAGAFEMGTDGTAVDIMNMIREVPSAKGIVVFGNREAVGEVFKAIQSTGSTGQFVVLAGTGWGENTLPASLNNVASGSLTMSLRTSPSADFTTFLQSLNPTSSNIPFYSDLFESIFDCSLETQNMRGFSQACNQNSRIPNDPTAYSTTIQNSIPFTIRAVDILASAVNQVVLEICQAPRPCSAFFNDHHAREMIMKKVRESSGSLLSYSYQVLNYRPLQAAQFVQVATYDPLNQVTTMTSNPIVFPNNGGVGSMMGLCQGFCQACHYLIPKQPYIHMKGDITLGALVGMSERSSLPFVCGNPKVQDGFQYTAAIKYALEMINTGMAPFSLRGVELGSLIMDDCDIAERAAVLTGGLYSRVFNPPDLDIDQVRGWLTFSSDSTMEIGSFLGKLNVPVVSPFASALELRDEERFPSLFLTVPRVDKLVSAIVQLVESLGFPYIEVLYSPTAFGRSAMEELEQVVKAERICVVNSVEMNPGDNSMAIQRLKSTMSNIVIVLAEQSYNSGPLNQIAAAFDRNTVLFITSSPMSIQTQHEITISLQEPQLPNLKTFLSKEKNSFFTRYFEQRFQCYLPQSLHRGFANPCTGTAADLILNAPLDSNVLSTINAVYALGAAIEKTLRQQCGTNYTGVCAKFDLSKDTNSMILKNLETVVFKDLSGLDFRFDERESIQNFEVLQRSGNNYVKVGSFSSGYLSLMDRDTQARALLTAATQINSTCRAPCTKCIEKSLDFTFVPGDVYIGGMFDVHMRSISPFTCGNVKTLHGFQLLEAFQFAIERVNNKMGMFANKLNGVKLGAIGMDSCESSVRTGYQISNIHNGRYELKKDGYEVDPADIKAYVASYESDRTKYLARILSSLEIPQVSYGATSIELSDQERYPFFIRTVPSDDHQSDAILQFLDNEDLRYVQLLSSPTNYGRLGSKVFQERASKRRICIAQSVVFPDNGTITRESANDAVTTLLEKPLANIIVIFADTEYLNGFLLAVQRNAEAHQKFRFVGTIMWSLNFRMDPSVLETSIGSITLNLESADMTEFDKYLNTKTPANYRENPWFDEYYEEIHNCFLRPPFNSFFQTRPTCGTDFKSVALASKYVQDPGVLHVVNAVYATAHGVDYALKSLCGVNYTGVCEAFRSSSSVSDLIFEGMEEASFLDDTNRHFEFTDQRDGNKGYSLYSIEKSTANVNGYIYKKIATYQNQSGLAMLEYENTWKGSCDRPRVCTECPELRDSVTRFMEYAPGIGPNMVSATIVAVFDLHKSQPYDEFICGAMNYDVAFHNILAFYYTLEKLVNNQAEFSNKIKINGIALDTCSSNIRVDSDLYGLISGNGLCHTATNLAEKVNLNDIAAVITLGDDNTFAANRVLSPVKISTISPNAMSPMFQNIERYDYLLRASPPSSDQVLAILSLLGRMGWNYVSVVYTDEHYGTDLHDNLQKQVTSGSYPVCLAISLSVNEDSSNSAYQSIVRSLDEQGKKGAHVVLLFTTKSATIKMINAFKSVAPSTEFILVGTDSWGVDTDVIKNQESFLAGAITLKSVKPQVPSFKNFFAELSYSDRKNLPTDWFEEWYQHFHRCHLTNSIVNLRDQYQSKCQTNLLLNATMLHHDMSVYHTILSTYLVAKGLDISLKDCNANTLSECLAQEGEKFRSKMFTDTLDLQLNNIQNKLNVLSQNDYDFSFSNMRYGNTGYMVNFVSYGNAGRLEYKEIGNWTSSLLLGDVSYYTDKESTCLLKDKCSCAVFGPVTGALSSNPEWASLGVEPRNYYAIEAVTYSDGTTGYKRTFEWPIWAIVLGVLTSLGILVCLFLFILLICCYPVKSGTTILGFLLLIGIIGIYAINFAFFLPASVVTCGARRFVMGIVYAICFAALLVKAADNWRYTEFDTELKKYKGITSVFALFLIALFLILIQVIIPIMWLLVEAPAAFLLSDTVGLHDFWWCGPPLFYDVSLVLSFIYVVILVLLTILFAVLAWYNANNNYEARWILGVSISTAGIMMVWMLVSTMSAAHYRDAAVAIGNWVNATILLICLPLRKTYLLFRLLHEGSEDDMSEKDDKNDFISGYSDQRFEMSSYPYQSKSALDGDEELVVYTTHGGEVLLQKSVHQNEAVFSQQEAMDMSQNLQEIDEQTRTMNVGEEDTGNMAIVIESSGSAAVAAEAPPMEGEGLAVAKLHTDDGVERMTHTELQSSIRQEEYMTYKTQYEYEVDVPVEMPPEQGPETVIITETVSDGDSDSDFSNSSDDDDEEFHEGDITRDHQRSLTKTYSYEVTKDEIHTTLE